MALGNGLAALLGGQMTSVLEGFTLSDLKVPCAVCVVSYAAPASADVMPEERAVTVVLGTPVCAVHGAELVRKLTA